MEGVYRPSTDGPPGNMRVGVDESSADQNKNGTIPKDTTLQNGSAVELCHEDETPSRRDQSRRENTTRVFLQMAVCVMAGFLFGLAFEKSRVFEPESIRGQMVMRRWIMLKMFLAAVGSGQLCLAILSLLPWTKLNFEHAAEAFVGCFSEKGFISTVVGALALGAGMTVSGACPGMVLAQVGSWTKNSIFTLIGVLIGALLYGLVAPWVVKFTRPAQPMEKPTVYLKFGIPFAALAIPMALLLGVAVFLMEWFIPWRNDLDPTRRNPPGVNIIRAISWPPSVAGVLIGLMQIFIVLGVGDTLGGSSSYVTVVSQWVVTERLQKVFPYLARARTGVGNWWQVMFVCSAVLGALFAALSSDTLSTTKGVSIGAAIGGGILLIVGARFAAGCTSGHGLSGVGLLAWLSFIAVPCMFGGGIATAFAMRATGALCDWDYHTPIANDTSIC